MKQWGKNWFYRITFFTAILMLLAGIFYLFRELILAGSSQFTSYDVTQEGVNAPQENPEPATVSDQLMETAHSEAVSSSELPRQTEPLSPTSAQTDSEESAAAVRTLDPEKPIVALTFDDGPGQGTSNILDLLEQHNVPATFFVIGQCLEQPVQVEKLQRAYDLGCTIGSHTYDHISFEKLNAEQIRSQTARVNELLLQYIGETAALVRPPYGHITDTAREAAETPYIHWSIDTEDWLSRDAASVIAIVQENVQDGDIILMHDIYPSTAEACETLIPWLIDQGYQLVTVPEMMEIRGITMENGQRYKNAYTK